MDDKISAKTPSGVPERLPPPSALEQLDEAARRGDLEVARRLIEEEDVNFLEGLPLHWAAINGSCDVVR